MNPCQPGSEEHAAWSRQVAGEGAVLLADVCDMLTRYVVFPSEHAIVAVALWIVATHAQTAWEHATRLVLNSPEKRCGKTRLQEIVSRLAHNPLRTVNISVAALARCIGEDDPPTIILDEADTVFATRRGERSEKAEDLRGILNSGHGRGWPYIRWDAVHNRPEECPTFAMALIAAIGNLPDTIEDRAVIVSMRRRAPNEIVTPFRERRARDELDALRARIHTWVSERLEALGKAEPLMPVEDRDADVWEPLVVIADSAGGDWPNLARAACTALTAQTGDDAGSVGARLLADLRDVFKDEPKLPTTTIIERLKAIDEAPWADWRDRGLSSKDLAGLLRPYGVHSKNIRAASAGDKPVKGYERADLHDPWRRYTDSGDISDAGPRYTRYTRYEDPFSHVNHVADERATSATYPLHESDPAVVADAVSSSATDPLHAFVQVSALPMVDVADVADVADTRLPCNVCGTALDPVLVADGHTTHPGCDGS